MSPLKHLLLVLTFLLVGCSKSKNNINNSVLQSLHDLSVVDQIILDVNDSTINKLIYPQVVRQSDTDFLVTISVIDNSLKFYDLDLKKITKTIFFQPNGKSGFGDLLSAVVYGGDSIMYLNKSSELFFMDQSKNISKKVILKDFDEKGLPLFYSNILSPILKDSNTWIFPNYYTTKSDRRINVSLDMKTGELLYSNKVPEEFVRGFHSIGDYINWNYVFNPNEEIIVFNFPNLSDLYIYDLNLNLKRKVKAKSNIQKGEIEPLVHVDLNVKQNSVGLSKEKVFERMKSNFIYSDLIYNESRDQYYRLVGHPISEYAQKLKDPVKSEVRNYSLIVLNSDFEIEEELLIPYNKYHIKADGFLIYQGKLLLEQKVEGENQIILDIIEL